MGKADKLPFGTNLLKPPEQELTEASYLFNLSKYRLNRCLSLTKEDETCWFKKEELGESD